MACNESKCRVDEKYVTGDSTNKEKFEAWAKTLESCVGNPYTTGQQLN